jgi:hypothetical protein
MKLHILMMIISIAALFSSCSFNQNSCSGSTEVRDTALIFSSMNVDTVYAQNGRYSHQIGWEVVSSYIYRNDAHKNCRNKSGTLYLYNNPILDSTITLVCNQDLNWYDKKLIPAGTNLLGPAVNETGLAKKSGSTAVNIDADSIKTGIYTYRISGLNKWGAHLSDSIDITYQ